MYSLNLYFLHYKSVTITPRIESEFSFLGGKFCVLIHMKGIPLFDR